jgi:hypothetical protein
MAKAKFTTHDLRTFLKRKKIATLSQLKAVLGTSGTMTVFRGLKALGYHSSYSHRGKFYALRGLPDFDQRGLWSYHGVRFSKHGNLVKTAQEFVEQAEAGLTAGEFEEIVHVGCKRPLLKLWREGRIVREKIGAEYVYFCSQRGRRTNQRRLCEERIARVDVRSPPIEALTDELKAAIILFLSLLDERQRRLYAGLESQKLGHGGDRKMAQWLGLDVHTVARGRRELFSAQIDRSRIRRQGGGRKRVEKKRR